MYRQNERKEAVKEVQKFLFFISSEIYEDIPRIPIDGIFDEETKGATMAYQNKKGINQTGIVDYETYTLLYEDYLSALEKQAPSPYIFTKEEPIITEGDNNEAVRFLHILINELEGRFVNIEKVGTGSYFDKKTGDMLEILSTIFNFEKQRVLDQKLYNRILNEINALNLVIK